MDKLSDDLCLKLSRTVRSEHCRRSARHAVLRSKTAGPEFREIYRSLASLWQMLGDEIERRPASSTRSNRSRRAVIDSPVDSEIPN
jgi:hypothetical protein